MAKKTLRKITLERNIVTSEKEDGTLTTETIRFVIKSEYPPDALSHFCESLDKIVQDPEKYETGESAVDEARKHLKEIPLRAIVRITSSRKSESDNLDMPIHIEVSNGEENRICIGVNGGKTYKAEKEIFEILIEIKRKKIFGIF